MLRTFSVRLFGLFWVIMISVSLGCARRDSIENDVEPVGWEWGAFPVESALPIARVDARVQAELSTRFYAPSNGHLRVMVAGGTSEAEKNFMWAVFSPDSLKLGSEMLEARRTALKIRWEILNRVDLPQKRLEIEKKLREAKRLQSITARFEADEEAWRTLAELMPEAGLDSADRSLSVINRTVTILEQQLSLLDSEDGGSASQELQVAEIELRQAEIEHELKRVQYEMHMPFDGQLVCNLDLRDGVIDYPVSSGQLIGVARKYDALTCEVRMQDSRWLALPAESLFLNMRLSDGRQITLPFSGRRVREEMRNEVLYYVFDVPGPALGVLRRNIDSVLPAELVLKLDRPARIVPKMKLLTVYPRAFSAADWTSGVNTVWPGCSVLASGTALLAIDTEASARVQ